MMKTYAIGDIHGCYYTLLALIEKMSPSLADRIIFMGDYVDRGPNSKKVLDYLIKLKQEKWNVFILKGNHEEMFLHSVLGKNELLAWIFNGGKYTLDSFGVSAANKIDKQYFEFIENMHNYVQIENTYFVHAGFNEEIPFTFTDTKSMLWSRTDQYYSPFLRDKLIVHGHTPQKLEQLQKQKDNSQGTINMDTGCVYGPGKGYGYLCALELNSRELFYVENKEGEYFN
jgi:serine/threonine protein phosphatase 1